MTNDESQLDAQIAASTENMTEDELDQLAEQGTNGAIAASLEYHRRQHGIYHYTDCKICIAEYRAGAEQELRDEVNADHAADWQDAGLDPEREIYWARREIADICSTIYGAEEDLTAAEMRDFLTKLTELTATLETMEGN